MTEHSDVTVAFGKTWTDSVKYGKAFVYVPNDLLKRLNVRDLRNKFFDAVERNVKYRKAVPMDEAAFFSSLRLAIQNEDAGKRSVLVYLHGFATTFEQAAQRSAAIGFALGMNTTAFFSWASAGNGLSYRQDLRSVESSSEAMAAFLIRIAQESKAEKVHIVAHSMGNHGLFQVAIDPVLRAAQSEGVKFGHIVLAAPDVDARTFVQKLKYVRDMSEHVTMYVSSNDKALWMSKQLASWPVAGLRKPPIETEGVDTVDVSDTDLTFLGHSYVASDTAVLGDMTQLLVESKLPGQRSNLRKVDAHWKLLK